MRSIEGLDLTPDAANLATVFSPLDQGFVRDPYPVYKLLRENDPVHRCHLGYWVVTRYDDVLQGMKDTRLSNEPSRFAVVNRRNKAKYTAANVADNIIPFMDPPRHSESRKLISRTFHEHLKTNPPDIDQMVEQLFTGFRKKGEIDIIHDLGTPLSIHVGCDLLGIPRQDAKILKDWSYWFFYLFSVIPSNEVLDNLNRALTEFRDYLYQHLEERKNNPDNSLISKLIQRSREQHILSEAEIIDTCMLLFADGVENVDSAIGNCVSCLLKHPDQFELLRSRPELIRKTIEECLRYEAPGQFIAKIAKEDFSWHGKNIRRHDAVMLVLGSANRDPNKFSAADTFNIQRKENTHLAFGMGPHICIGAPLVRMELKSALGFILQNLENMRLKNSELCWDARLAHRWLTSLAVSFDAY
jgi:cytochrome P450